MRLAPAALVLLAACGSEPLPPENPKAGAGEPSMVPVATTRRLDIAGRWAVNTNQCETGWWDFASDQVRTAGELTCLVVKDERTADTATLQLSCVGEGRPSTEVWRLAGTREQMTVTRGKAPLTLVRCAL